MLFCLALYFFVFAGPKTQVLFVGGYGSTEEQLRNWKNAIPPSPNYDFEALPFPARKPDQNSVLRDGQKMIKTLVEKIDNAPLGSQFILAGHSSGSAIANEVARRIMRKFRQIWSG